MALVRISKTSMISGRRTGKRGGLNDALGTSGVYRMLNGRYHSTLYLGIQKYCAGDGAGIWDTTETPIVADGKVAINVFGELVTNDAGATFNWEVSFFTTSWQPFADVATFGIVNGTSVFDQESSGDEGPVGSIPEGHDSQIRLKVTVTYSDATTETFVSEAVVTGTNVDTENSAFADSIDVQVTPLDPVALTQIGAQGSAPGVPSLADSASPHAFTDCA